jgi:hypothetical protein
MSSIAGQTMIRRFLCDFHPVTMTPFIRELEPRPREEVIKYAIPATHFPPSISATVTSSFRMDSQIASEVLGTNSIVAPMPEIVSVAVAAPAVTTGYVPPHLRRANGGAGAGAGAGSSVMPEHHVAKPAAAAPSSYVPPHLRRKTAVAEPVSMTKLTNKKVAVDEFPTLGSGSGSGSIEPKTKKATWGKGTSFATIVAKPVAVEVKEPEDDVATIIRRENERLRLALAAQSQQRSMAKFDAMIGQMQSGNVVERFEGGGGGGGYSDDEEQNYDYENADHDKYYD